MKKKLRLLVDELRVEQFQVAPAAAGQGTVRGFESTQECTAYCGDSMNANTAPCRLCPEMPITYSCDFCG